MIVLNHYQHKKVAVLGLGKTGLAAAQALHASGAQLVIWDDNAKTCEQLPVALAQFVKPYSEWEWAGLDAMVLSPGIPLTHPKPHDAVRLAQQHSVSITSDIELLYEACPHATYIAITGTNGKSTTTALIGHILKQAGRNVQVGGNIGTAALAMAPLGKGDIYVLELSSYQLDLLHTTRFNVAVWLNISPDHIDRHGDIDGYIAAKKHIFDRQQPADVAVIGVDDAYSEAVCREKIVAAGAQVMPIMTTQKSDKGVWVKDGVLHAPGEAAVPLDEMTTLRGQHNHQNAAAAYAACRAVGVAADAIIAAMKTFPGLAHRMQRVATVDGVAFVNDSKATNADAAAKSLGSYDDIFWIAGGVAKEGGIAALARYFPRVKQAFLIGQARDDFARTLQDHVPYELCDSLQEAVRRAYEAARSYEGATVLLAPACASFDQFPNFEVRGEVFVSACQSLSGEQGKK